MRRSLVVFAMALAVGAARAESPCSRGPTRDWRDGPARYLLTDDEWRRFGRLENSEARASFVARFWRRLESGASGSPPGFRERFETRCLEAESRFRRDDPAGWLSDRGRVLILLGEPESIERLPGDAESVAREVWVYPYAAAGASSSLRIPFYRGRDGRVRLEAPRAATNVGTPVVVDALRGRVRSVSRATEPIRGTAVGAVLDAILARPAVEPPPAPPPAALPPASLAAPEVASVTSGLLDGAWFFTAADGSVLVLLAVALVPGSGLDEDSARGSAFVVDGAAAGRGEGASVALTPARGSARGRLLHVGHLLLEPGTTTRIRYAFSDAGGETILVRTRPLSVPELGTGGFSVSSLVPAESFGPLPEAVDTVFAVGSEMVVPRPEASFARGETLRLYLQFYGAEPDPAGGWPRVDVEFRFLRETGRKLVRQGSPLRLRGASGASLGLSLPIGDWPPGAYRAEVTLRDRVAGRVATAEGSFRVTQ